METLSLPTGYSRWSSPPNLDSNCLISSWSSVEQDVSLAASTDPNHSSAVHSQHSSNEISPSISTSSQFSEGWRSNIGFESFELRIASALSQEVNSATEPSEKANLTRSSWPSGLLRNGLGFWLANLSSELWLASAPFV